MSSSTIDQTKDNEEQQMDRYAGMSVQQIFDSIVADLRSSDTGVRERGVAMANRWHLDERYLQRAYGFDARGMGVPAI